MAHGPPSFRVCREHADRVGQCRAVLRRHDHGPRLAQDLRGFAGMAHGLTRWMATGAAYLVPNFSAFNVVGSIAHEQPVAAQLIWHNTLYALFYAAMALSGAVLIFEHRNLK